VIRLHAPLAELSAKVRPQDGQLEEVEPGICELRTQGDSLEWLAAWIGWFGVDFEILEPAELVDHVRTLAARLGSSVA
jgi:predicted DNA-binding transcriptional regulator YafY